MMEISSITDKRTGKNICPLKSVEVKALIGDDLAEVTVEQHYVNLNTGNIEAIYTFPIRHKAMVNNFKAKIGENRDYR